MRKEFLSHKLAYLVLVLFLGLSVFLFLAVWPDRAYQRYLTLLISIFYFFWGVVSHTKSKTITKKIVIEYLAVSCLSGLILLLVTL